MLDGVLNIFPALFKPDFVKLFPLKGCTVRTYSIITVTHVTLRTVKWLHS